MMRALAKSHLRRTLLALCLLAPAAPATAQDPPSGIRVSGEYDVRQRPVIAVRPFAGAEPIAAVVDSIKGIIQRDLLFSDRYNLMEAVPQQLRTGDINYPEWNALRVTYLVTGDVTPTARGYELRLVVHDVPWSRLVTEQRFALPAATAPDFRMAVHAIADDIVQRTLNAPGVAATRIAITRKNPSTEGTNDDLLIVDSDGFGLRRIAGFGGQLYSPAWSPDGRRILYTINGERGWQLVERDVTSGSQRFISPGGDMVMTPAYARDDGHIVMGLWRGDRSEITVYDLRQQCCARRISGQGRNIEMYPSYSFDGRLLVFVSNRVGNPAIFVANADGSNATLITPFVAGQSSHYSGPAFSPTDTKIAFHGDWNIRDANGEAFQIMIADASRPGSQIMQLTNGGVNEDPSWAPDGRHIVYTATEMRGQADGLYVIDSESKIRRLLVRGANMRMADWSPPLVRAADLVVR